MVQFHATTICAVKRPDGDICIGGDGQVTMGETTIMKNGAKKVKKIFKGKVLTGFAGSVADAFSLTDKFENKLQEHDGNLKRAAVDLAQFWRSDKATRSLEALMIVVNEEDLLVISGKLLNLIKMSLLLVLAVIMRILLLPLYLIILN